MNEDDYKDAINSNDYKTLNKHLYRVQKISKGDYKFRFHIETQIDDSKQANEMKKYYRVTGLVSLLKYNPRKIKIEVLGKIDEV